MAVPLLRGLLPLSRDRIGPDVLAGLTLAALAVPEVLGYARIAGMPVVTGLYTMLIPVVVFALLGASRHLVVGADSATAAILAAGLVGVAGAGSARYVELAGTAALLAGVLLLVARVIRLGFLANFLSRTVLVGFLTGVGIQVAVGQLPAMAGIPAAHGDTVAILVTIAGGLAQVNVATLVVAAAVLVVVLGLRLVNHRIPGALIAVAAAILLSHLLDLEAHGVAVLGAVPTGLPGVALPSFAVDDLLALAPLAASMFVVILAQSAATARAYAARYDERPDENTDLVGLGAANIAAAFSGTFVVNGSPTKTQMVDGAGGRSQVAHLTSAVVVLLVLLFLTGTLSALPLAALGAVVLVIGVDLIDIVGLRQIRAARPAEFVVAVLTTAAVVFIGVEQGVILAVVASIVDHLRHSYNPRNSVLVKSARGHWQSMPVTPGGRTAGDLVIYRFGTSLYFANASRLAADMTELVGEHPPVWFCMDAAAIGDIDYSAEAVLATVVKILDGKGTRLVFSGVTDDVRAQLDRYGITARVGAAAFYDTAGAALEAFEQEHGKGSSR
ncbi:SulP family inorganic anion transporter [Pseudonocardia sp. GCM10023141]|uniref:SulP family inorganic anion transporter n=1 Tax=Pseudonocardia sp. GCM10023141 TaxID=3252653 RepID=UPI003621F5D0